MKLALLTIDYAIEELAIKDIKTPFYPDLCFLDLAIYELRPPELTLKVPDSWTAEQRIIMQLQGPSGVGYKGRAQVLDAMTFNDDRSVEEIAKDLLSRFNGNLGGGVFGVSCEVSFKITSLDRIQREFFNPTRTALAGFFKS